MGYKIDWIAVQGAMGGVLAALDLEEAGEASDPMYAPCCCASLPDGWLVIASADRNLSVEQSLARIAAPGLSLGGEMSETVMVSRAVGFDGGHMAWSVGHDPDKGLDEVQISGDPPALLSDIVRGLKQQQQADETGDVDYLFDAPIDLLARISGFRPDKEAALEWRVLRPKSAGGRPGTELDEPVPNIRSALAPLMASLGWAATTTRPDLFVPAASHEFFRIRDNLHHIMWFDFGWQASPAGDLPFFKVGFVVRESGSAELPPAEPLLSGDALRSEASPPLWKRLFSSRAAQPSRAQLMAKLLDGAREDIRAVDEFLRTGVRAPSVHLGRGSARETWPSLPS